MVFVLLTAGFLLKLWGSYSVPPPHQPTPSVFTNPATVRLSTAELTELEEDVSGTACYACHEEGVARELAYDDNGMVMLPAAHKDLIYSRMNCAACHDPEEGVEVEYDDDVNVIIPPAHQNAVLRHGTHARNNNCYNCHVATNLTVLRTRSGEEFPLSNTTQVCGGCHGPTLRDWEAGIHGRWNGFWLASSGEQKRTGCTSCHDPHAPAFPFMIPGPPPARPDTDRHTPQHDSLSDHANRDE